METRINRTFNKVPMLKIIVNLTCKNRTNVYSKNIDQFIQVSGLIRVQMPLVEQELLTLPEHLNSTLFLVGFVLLDL